MNSFLQVSPLPPIGDLLADAWQDPLYKPFVLGLIVIVIFLVAVVFLAFRSESSFRETSVPDLESTRTSPGRRSGVNGAPDAEADSWDDVRAADGQPDPLRQASRGEKMMAEELRLLQIENERLRERIAQTLGGSPPSSSSDR